MKLRQAIHEYHDVMLKQGVGSNEALEVREKYQQLEGFTAYADSMDRIRKTLLDKKNTPVPPNHA